MKAWGRLSQASRSVSGPIRAFLADESGEILTVMAVSWAVGTFILGASGTAATVMNMGTTAEAAETMQLGAIAQRQKFEESPELQKKVPAERKKELYAKWDAMEKFADQSNKKAFVDGMWSTAELAVDLGLNAVAPQGKAKVVVDAAQEVLDAKTALYDVPAAVKENNSDLAPEMLEYTRDMTEKLDGRKSAEEFLAPMRKTAAINKIVDMGADSAQVKAFPDEGGAAQHVVRERMADAIARSYTDLKKRDEKLSYGDQPDEGAYEEFMRRQVLGTHPRELEGSKSGDVFADKEAMNLFDEGKLDSLLAMIQTENGPVLVELKREAGEKLVAVSLTTSEEMTEVIDEGKAAEKSEGSEEAPAEDPKKSFAGKYSGTIGISLTGGATQSMPCAMQVADDGSFAFTINYSGSGSGWRQDWMSGLRWSTKITGTVAENGTVAGSGTRSTTTIAADGNSPPTNTTAATITGKITGDTFTGTMKMDSWKSTMPSVKLTRD